MSIPDFAELIYIFNRYGSDSKEMTGAFNILANNRISTHITNPLVLKNFIKYIVKQGGKYETINGESYLFYN